MNPRDATLSSQSASPFDKYVELLVSLHKHIREGRGNDAIADDVRDQMDGPWESMTQREIELADELSVDLYSIGVERVPVGAVNEQEAVEFLSAFESNDLPLALSILRRIAPALSPVEVAIQRGICWKRMGHHKVAAEFFQEAIRAEPHDSRAIALYLQHLLNTNSLEAARDLATALLVSDETPLTRIIAGKCLLILSNFIPRSELTRIAEKSILDAVEGLDSEHDEFVLDQAKFARLALAMLYESSGKYQEALAQCNKALELDPRDTFALELKGALRIQDDPQKGANGFRQELIDLLGHELPAALNTFSPSHN